MAGLSRTDHRPTDDDNNDDDDNDDVKTARDSSPKSH